MVAPGKPERPRILGQGATGDRGTRGHVARGGHGRSQTIADPLDKLGVGLAGSDLADGYALLHRKEKDRVDRAHARLARYARKADARHVGHTITGEACRGDDGRDGVSRQRKRDQVASIDVAHRRQRPGGRAREVTLERPLGLVRTGKGDVAQPAGHTRKGTGDHRGRRAWVGRVQTKRANRVGHVTHRHLARLDAQVVGKLACVGHGVRIPMAHDQAANPGRAQGVAGDRGDDGARQVSRKGDTGAAPASLPGGRRNQVSREDHVTNRKDQRLPQEGGTLVRDAVYGLVQGPLGADVDLAGHERLLEGRQRAGQLAPRGHDKAASTKDLLTIGAHGSDRDHPCVERRRGRCHQAAVCHRGRKRGGLVIRREAREGQVQHGIEVEPGVLEVVKPVRSQRDTEAGAIHREPDRTLRKVGSRRLLRVVSASHRGGHAQRHETALLDIDDLLVGRVGRLGKHRHDRADGQVAGKVAQGMGAVREELVVIRQSTGVAAA